MLFACRLLRIVLLSLALTIGWIVPRIMDAPAAHAATITVNDTGDAPRDPTAPAGVCRTAPANTTCTLRAAMQTADAVGVPGTAAVIAFNLPGAGPFTISPLSPLPTLLNTVTIDATTQPGFTVVPIVEINGAGAGGPAVDGIRMTGDGLSGQQIKGLVVNRFSGNGIVILGAGLVTVSTNYVGLNLQGTAAAPNALNGVLVQAGTLNTVGGSTGTAGNLIAGNGQNGISVAAPSTRIQGNLIGFVNPSGTAAVPNGVDGIAFTAGTGQSVGGSTSGFRNVISGNTRHGISLASGVTGASINGNTIGLNVLGTAKVPNGGSGIFLAAGADTSSIGTTGGNIISGNTGSGLDLRSNGNTVRNNRIGTDSAGTAGLGNGGDGVAIQGSTNQIAGTSTANANTIQGNTGVGVKILSGTGNTVRFNSIFANGAGTIVLAAGANNNQVPPTITSVVIGSTIVNGSILSTPNTTFIVDVYFNPPGAPAAQQVFFGTIQVTTDNAGFATWTVTDPSQTAASGTTFTATLTRVSTGDTSGTSTGFTFTTVVASSTPTNTPTATPSSTPTQTAGIPGAPTSTPTPTIAIPGGPSSTPTATSGLIGAPSNTPTPTSVSGATSRTPTITPTPAPPSILRLQKTADRALPVVGGGLQRSFRIRLTADFERAFDVAVDDLLPAGLTVVVTPSVASGPRGSKNPSDFIPVRGASCTVETVAGRQKIHCTIPEVGFGEYVIFVSVAEEQPFYTNTATAEGRNAEQVRAFVTVSPGGTTAGVLAGLCGSGGTGTCQPACDPAGACTIDLAPGLCDTAGTCQATCTPSGVCTIPSSQICGTAPGTGCQAQCDPQSLECVIPNNTVGQCTGGACQTDCANRGGCQNECTDAGSCTVDGQLAGSTGQVTHSMSWRIVVQAGLIPTGAGATVFIPTTRGLEFFACPAAVAGAPTVCTGRTAGNGIKGGRVRVFAGGLLVATGTIRGPGVADGTRAAVILPLLPPLLPPPPPPLPPPFLAPPPALPFGPMPAVEARQAASEVPVIPEAPPVALLVAALVGLGALALRRR